MTAGLIIYVVVYLAIIGFGLCALAPWVAERHKTERRRKP